MNRWRVVVGDALERLRELDDGCVQTCVTSPPYFGLRDYGTGEWAGGDPACEHIKETPIHADGTSTLGVPADGGPRRIGEDNATVVGKGVYRDLCGKCGATRIDSQLGLEATPDEYVARLVGVFREVRRVLRDDGTLWLNLGDSYAGGPVSGAPRPGAGRADGVVDDRAQRNRNGVGAIPGAKPKDLLGIPWMVAFALRQPYYDGDIKREQERIWLAAMIDTEGSIGINWQRGGEHRARDSYNLSIKVSNTSRTLVERCAEVAGCGSALLHDRRGRDCFAWSVYGQDARRILREVYPYLVAKQQEARVAYGTPTHETYEAMRLLHAGNETTVDAPGPPDCWTPGWYLRSDIVWAKPNPMPESVTDRPTKAHEYVFLLSKSPRYFYDADAVREASEDTQAVKAGRAEGWSSAQGMRPEWMQKRTDINNNNGLGDRSEARRHNRNKRSVWTVATAPFSWRKNARRVRVELDDVDDGTERITSRDCPVHGDRPVPVPTESHGGREGPDPSRSPGTDAGHAREQLGGFAPTAPLLEPSSEGGSSGSPAPGRADSATPRSTRSRRTDPVPATSSACTPSAETAGRTGDTSASPETPVELRPDTRASRTLSDGSADRQSSGTPDRTAHKSAQQDDSACTCRYYRLDETDHFAVFPPKLIEPCVLAGSAEDACGVCGAPWQRVVEAPEALKESPAPGSVKIEATHGRSIRRGPGTTMSNDPAQRVAAAPRTVGFEPSCSHMCSNHPDDVDPQPPDDRGSCTVLDPFSGAGTTGLVATRLGRSYIGIELNESYAEMSRERIRDDAPLMNYILEAV